MCGIAGIYNFENQKVNIDDIELLCNSLYHRGPDSSGVKTFDNIAIAHRRLSIIDLSSSANQPMATEDGRFYIVFNGEIYNFKEIKIKLLEKGIAFNTESDTEVVLKAFQYFGESCFEMFNGMFAIAILDRENSQLVLARDTFGMKPLYYYVDDKTFIFASEKKAILQKYDLAVSLNRQALVEYLWYGNPLGDNTFYNEIQELTPGSYLKVKQGGIHKNTFFDINQIAENPTEEEVAIKDIRRLLDNSVQRHLISDVPVGVFLSGGIDSSAITAFASKYSEKKIDTFSVGFDFHRGVNELEKARFIAKKYNTNHHEVQISGGNIIDVIEHLVDMHDEPFADAADIPLYLLTREIKGQIKVVLQGDGGDEFFGGYSRYKTLNQVSRWKYLGFISSLINISGTKNTSILRLRRFLEAINQKEAYLRNALLLTMESFPANPANVLAKGIKESLEGLDPFSKYKEVYSNYRNNLDSIQALYYTDAQIILKDTFFTKVDKSTMANSIEVRLPFLDKDLTQYMLGVPASLKSKGGQQKYLLKRALEGVVPNEILYGKKTGFGVPYDFWLKEYLYQYVIEQISTPVLAEVIDKNKVVGMLKLHKRGKGNYGFMLWKVLIFAIWVNRNNKVVIN